MINCAEPEASESIYNAQNAAAFPEKYTAMLENLYKAQKHADNVNVQSENKEYRKH